MSPTTCIQCAMKALVAGEPAPVFDETPEEHLRRVHPDPIAAQQERWELEAQLVKKLYAADQERHE